MKDLFSKFEALWISVTFAEAGEFEASLRFTADEPCSADSPEMPQAA